MSLYAIVCHCTSMSWHDGIVVDYQLQGNEPLGAPQYRSQTPPRWHPEELKRALKVRLSKSSVKLAKMTLYCLFGLQSFFKTLRNLGNWQHTLSSASLNFHQDTLSRLIISSSGSQSGGVWLLHLGLAGSLIVSIYLSRRETTKPPGRQECQEARRHGARRV